MPTPSPRPRSPPALERTSSATGELTRDEILDNITLYWLTNTGVSSSRLYWEYKGGFFNAKGVKIPVAVTVFPSEQYEAPRSWTERAYPEAHPLQPRRQGRPFRRMGTTADIRQRTARRIQVGAMIMRTDGKPMDETHRPARRPDRRPAEDLHADDGRGLFS